MANKNIAKLPDKVKAKLDDWVEGEYQTLFWWEQDQTWFVVIQYLTIIQFIRLFPVGDQIALSADGTKDVDEIIKAVKEPEQA
jgi:hypothetical protein